MVRWTGQRELGQLIWYRPENNVFMNQIFHKRHYPLTSNSMAAYTAEARHCAPGKRIHKNHLSSPCKCGAIKACNAALEILAEMMFHCKLAFPLSEHEWCFTFQFVAACHIISLYSIKAQLWLELLKQFSPADSPIAMPAAARSLTPASHSTVFLNAFLSSAVIIILLRWRDAAAPVSSNLFNKVTLWQFF